MGINNTKNFIKKHSETILAIILLVIIFTIGIYLISSSYIKDNYNSKIRIYHCYTSNNKADVICINSLLYYRSYYGNITPVYEKLKNGQISIKKCDDPNCIFKDKWPIIKD